MLNAGALDQSFGVGGEVMTDFGGGDFAMRVLTQTDGKIIAVGSSLAGSASRFALARYNLDGGLDPAFGTGGKVTSPLGLATSAALQADGDILVAGVNDGHNKFVLARYTTGGALDSNFGAGGFVTTNIAEPTNPGVAVQPDGKIVLTGFSLNPPPGFSTIELFRYNSNGTLDTTFGSAGKMTDLGKITSEVLIQPDGKIIVAGTGERTMTFNDTSFFVKRFNSDGSRDQGFQEPVNLGVGFNSAEDVALQADGKIVALGFSNDRPVLVRLNSDGSMDAGFGINGQVLIGFGRTLAIQKDGEIVVADATGTSLQVARYEPDGSLDTRFGVAGTATAPFANNVTLQSVALQADGNIVAAGSVSRMTPGDISDFALARFVGGASSALTGTPNQRFVKQVYLDVLARIADTGGLAFWTGLLDQNLANRTQVAAAIGSSHESHMLQVQRLFHQLLLRSADPSGDATWTGFLDRGGTGEQLAAILMGSLEYRSDNSLTPRGFVDALYRDILHRYADSAGEQSWQQFLDTGVPARDVAAAILATPESDQDEVQDFYHQFLHRPADPAGLSVFENQLQHGVANEQIMAIVLGSAEYFQIAQQ